jgi:hypothetical protein
LCLPITSIAYDRLAGTSAPNARFYQLQVLSNSAAAFEFQAGPEGR